MTQKRDTGSRFTFQAALIASALIAVVVTVLFNFSPGARNNGDGGNATNPSIGNIPEITAQNNAGSDTNTGSSPELTVVLKPVTFTIMNAGDFLTGPEIMRTLGPDHDFTSLLAPARPAVDSADLAVCHLEILSNRNGPTFRMDAAPVFSNPYNTLGQLKDNGWDACSAASNHSLDGGMPSIQDTLESSREYGIPLAGISDNADGNTVILIPLEKGGEHLTIAVISYTWSTNLIPKPASKPWAVNTFSRFDLNTLQPLIEDAQWARDNGADIVMASVHCCKEYSTEVDANQQAIAQYLADSGQIDVMIGHHPHVPQTINLIPGGVNGKGMWVAHSLGNYTAQLGKPWTDVGILAFTDVTVTRDTREIDINMRYTTVTTNFGTPTTVSLGGAENSIASIMAGSPAIYTPFE